MKAQTQYCDYLGTTASDESDHTSLNAFLESRGIDTERFYAIGATFYAGYIDYFSASIICVDKDNSTDDKPYIVKVGFGEGISKDEFFSLFKRFEVILTTRHGEYEKFEIDDEYLSEDIDNEE